MGPGIGSRVRVDGYLAMVAIGRASNVAMESIARAEVKVGIHSSPSFNLPDWLQLQLQWEETSGFLLGTHSD